MVFGQKRRSRTAALPLAGAVALSVAVTALWGHAADGSSFVAPGRRAGGRTALRAEIESGKVNLGVEPEAPTMLSESPLPTPVLECSQSCMTAIMDCVEEGCSVEALMKLDAQLASDEKAILDTVEQVKAQQKTAFSEENVGTLAWLENFLGRSSALRSQLQALKGFGDSDFIQQMMRAAAVSFGGGRKDDYPKIGASPYSA